MTWAAPGAEAELRSQLERAHQQLDALCYSLSHDLHSPLRTMQEMARILLEDFSQQTPADTQVFLTHLVQGTSRLADRVEGLARFGRISRQPPSFQRVDVAGLVAQLISDTNKSAGTGHIDFVIAELPDAIGDAAMLRQLFSTLLSNAIKFSRHSPAPRIEIGAHHEAGRNAYFVADNGAGFDMKYAARLFGLFQRMHPETQFEGAGVGLAIAQCIVERHGGTIRGEAAKEAGATFHFTLPAVGSGAEPGG